MNAKTYYSCVRMPRDVIDRAHENGLCAAKVCVKALNSASMGIEEQKEKEKV